MRYLFIGIFAIISNSLFSQWNKVAKPYQDKMDYYSAAKAYSKVLDTGKVEDFVQYTRVLFNQGEYKKTYENYLLLSRKNLIQEHYDLQAFRTCVSILDAGSLERFDVEYFELLKKFKVKGFESDLSKNETEYTIQSACFNSLDFEDLCPVGFENGILFTSSRLTVNGELGNYGYNDQPYYDVFYANGCDVQDIRGKLAKKLPSDINTHLHDGPVFVSEKSGLFFITRNIETNSGTMPMGIFFSLKSEKGWSKFTPLPVNNLNYTVQHPCFDDSLQTLYFSSNLSGGLGGFDIYSCKYLGQGKWAEPLNLGPNINTDLNEVFPSMYKNKLYFSSNGIKGKGGYDIFQFDKNNVIQIPSLNSQWDDYGIFFVNDSIGYLASNRINGFAKDDIMRFVLFKQTPVIYVETFANGHDQKKDWGEPKQTKLSFVIVDSISGDIVSIPKIQLTIQNVKSGLITNLKVRGDSLNIVLGHFAKDSLYNIHLDVLVEGYNSLNIDYKEVKRNDLGILDLGLVKLGRKVGFVPKIKYPTLKPIYFDLDKFTIRKDAASTLDSTVLMLKEFSNVKLELKAFTDSRATDNYNKQLSEKRAKATFKYLVKHGIKANRLIYAGYGEAGLVNDCGNDKECEDRMHQLNRRTELKMID
jgi:outer membrane protein OmpA-like peptidoglycan-associated protein